MKASVRCRSLSLGGAGANTLEAQEKHGKRQDGTSKQRRVGSAGPIYFHSLDLRAEFDRHLKGVRRNAGCRRPVLHFMIKFPDELLQDDAPGRFKQLKTTFERQVLMARQAVTFLNRTHGGDAVFAARLDRDEAGLTTVDVFAAPRYLKATRSGETTWTSPTKFGKALALRHQQEIRSRFPKAKGPLTAPRYVGIALQAEFALFFEEMNGVRLTPRTPKDRPAPDRLEVEAFKAFRQAEAALHHEQDTLALAREQLNRTAAALRERSNQERQLARVEVEKAAQARRRATTAAREVTELQERLRGLAGELSALLKRDDLQPTWKKDALRLGREMIDVMAPRPLS